MFSKDDYERKRALGIILKEIHNQIPKKNIDTSTISNHEIRSCFLEGKKAKKLIIYLRSSGCRWMLNDEHGGCTMCGHLAGSTLGKKISTLAYKVQFDKIIAQFDFKDIPMVCVYNEGSFFNEEEMPTITREYIFEKLNIISEIKCVIFETRPEYLTAEKLEVLRNLLPSKEVEIGIGLETSDDYTRQMCLNKGFLVDEFLQAIILLKKYGIRSLAYVLMKPPFLSEQLAIEDSIRTIKWAFQQGVDTVSLEPTSVQEYTLVHLLYNLEKYRPPWIWSVLKVVSEVGHLGLVRIGGFEFYPPPFVCTHNCSMCNEACVDAIEKYNASNDINIINTTLTMGCTSCTEEWLKQLQDNCNIETSIDTLLSAFQIDEISKFLA